MRCTNWNWGEKLMHRKKEIEIVCFLEVSTKFSHGLYKTPFPLKKMIWYDELADSDPFTPSCPHLHSWEEKYKLNVYTGEIYDIRSKKNISNKYVNEDELSKLWADTRFQQFACKMRDIYKEKFPNSVLPSIPTYNCKNKLERIHIVRLRCKKKIHKRMR